MAGLIFAACSNDSNELVPDTPEQAEEEIKYKDRYKYNVVNAELEKAVDEIMDILKRERSENR